MRAVTIALVILASTSAEAAEPRDSGVASPLESLPQSIWTVDANSVAHHVQTGLACPYTVGPFTLQSIATYNEVGLDVSCNYSASAGAVTIYLTKREDVPLEDDFAQAVYEIEYVHPDADALDAALIPQLQNAAPFLTALYHFPDRDAHSGIWITDFSGWTLKIRATYPVGGPDAAVQAIEELLALAEPAGAHLAACAMSPATERTGQIKQDETLPIVGALMLAAHAEPEAEPVTAIWCAESQLPVTRLPLLLWRNIGEDNGSSPLRVTGGTNGPPPILEVIGSSLGALTDDVPDDLAAAPLDYLLIGVPEDRPLLYLSFEGIPDAAVLGPVVEQIFLGERMPVANIGEGGSINIHMGEEN